MKIFRAIAASSLTVTLTACPPAPKDEETDDGANEEAGTTKGEQPDPAAPKPKPEV